VEVNTLKKKEARGKFSAPGISQRDSCPLLSSLIMDRTVIRDFTNFMMIDVGLLGLWKGYVYLRRWYLPSFRTEGHWPDDGGSKHIEMSVNFYQTTLCNIPEGSHLISCFLGAITLLCAFCLLLMQFEFVDTGNEQSGFHSAIKANITLNIKT
jgi:hypothetical protein